MPAELTYTNGAADFLGSETGEAPWHREGELIPPDREMTVPAAPKKMIEAAESLLAALVERFEAVATQYRRLKATRLPEPAFTRLVLSDGRRLARPSAS